MNSLRDITKYYLFTLLSVALVMNSCASEESSNSQETDLSVIICASISKESATRAYQEKGKVEFGTYYLTYSNPTSIPQYKTGTVNFYDGTGFVTTDAGEELTWNHVGFDQGGNSQSSTFYLDNVAYSSDDDSVTDIPLPTHNPYIAGKFDYEEGTNDLLWGKQTVNRYIGNVPIQLHHSMAMVRVIVSVDASAEGSIVQDLQNATVEITNIISTPVSYNRLTGVLDLGDNPFYSSLTVTAPGSNSWTDIANSDSNDKITVYTSPDMVLPPQDLTSGDLRPRLRISIPQEDGNSRIFSGPLPRAMIVENNDGSAVSENLSFKREHILTLRVNMDPELLELQFMPVTVIDWVNKGTYTLTGAQSAVFDDSDFMKMMVAYKDGNWTELERYGYESGNTWIFNIYGDLTLSEADIKGKMPEKEDNPYQIKFNGQTITIIQSNGNSLILNRDNNNEGELYNILQG